MTDKPHVETMAETWQRVQPATFSSPQQYILLLMKVDKKGLAKLVDGGVTIFFSDGSTYRMQGPQDRGRPTPVMGATRIRKYEDRKEEKAMMRTGQPFDADDHMHLNLRDVHVGMSLQADDGWKDIAPWAICTVQQAADGRLYVETNDGAPMFLADLIDPNDTCGGCLNGMFEVQPPTLRVISGQ